MSKKFQIVITLLITLFIIIIGGWLFIGNRFKASVTDIFSHAIDKVSEGRLSARHSITRLSGFPYSVALRLYNLRFKYTGVDETEWYIDSQEAMMVQSSFFSDTLRIVLPPELRLTRMVVDPDSDSGEMLEEGYLFSFNAPATIDVTFSDEGWLPWWFQDNTSLQDSDVSLTNVSLMLPELSFQEEGDVVDEKAIAEFQALWQQLNIRASVDQSASYRENILLQLHGEEVNWSYLLGLDTEFPSLSVDVSVLVDVPSEPDLYEVEPFSITLQKAEVLLGEFQGLASGRLNYREEVALNSGGLDMKLYNYPYVVKMISPVVELYEWIENYRDTAWYRSQLEAFIRQYLVVAVKNDAEDTVLHEVVFSFEDKKWKTKDNNWESVLEAFHKKFGYSGATRSGGHVSQKKAVSLQKKDKTSSRSVKKDAKSEAPYGNIGSPYTYNEGIKPRRRRR